jgi:mannose-6-phosphate isomerase
LRAIESALEPLRFERRLLEKVWGGRALERRFGFALPPGKGVGESWELVDRPGEDSVVAAGAFRGRTLGELVRARSREVLGRARPGKDGRFPLLVKYIDARENLSVQVHPDGEAARRLGGGAEPKTEAWYVLDVAPGAVLYAGLEPGVAREEFARVAAGPGVVERLRRLAVRPGDCVFVPGGTVHAIGGGVTILEVQENSDTTYRLWDWGRVGRETHVEAALACVRYGEPVRARPEPASPPAEPPSTSSDDGVRRRPLVRCDLFEMELLETDASVRVPASDRFQAYAVVSGGGALSVAGRSETFPLALGDVWLVPAACGAHVLEAGSGELAAVRISSPA